MTNGDDMMYEGSPVYPETVCRIMTPEGYALIKRALAAYVDHLHDSWDGWEDPDAYDREYELAVKLERSF